MMNKILIALIILSILTGCTGPMAELGIENGQLKKCPKTPNCVSSQAKDEKHFIAPIRISASPLEAQKYIVKILHELNRTKIIVAKDNYIRAEFVSRIFRFVDDVELYFSQTQSGKLIIHVRSAARVGYSDLGVNRKRIERIRKKLEEINKKTNENKHLL